MKECYKGERKREKYETDRAAETSVRVNPPKINSGRRNGRTSPTEEGLLLLLLRPTYVDRRCKRWYRSSGRPGSDPDRCFLKWKRKKIFLNSKRFQNTQKKIVFLSCQILNQIPFAFFEVGNEKRLLTAFTRTWRRNSSTILPIGRPSFFYIFALEIALVPPPSFHS